MLSEQHVRQLVSYFECIVNDVVNPEHSQLTDSSLDGTRRMVREGVTEDDVRQALAQKPARIVDGLQPGEGRWTAVQGQGDHPAHGPVELRAVLQVHEVHRHHDESEVRCGPEAGVPSCRVILDREGTQ
ncbi:hypothetical protein [Cystobacter fuscus]|uniref:hypothetical protein n=1 Tax=Cystobacter fuscus TaxID=43 RepID=UPI0012FDAD8C|nr:hypothetical protein [Cystobacter fuscus]